MITDEIIRCWRTNYGLEDNTPAEAAAWWEAKLGHAPSGAVAALGTCLDEIKRLRELLLEARDSWIKVGYGASHEDVIACRDLCERIDAALEEDR